MADFKYPASKYICIDNLILVNIRIIRRESGSGT